MTLIERKALARFTRVMAESGREIWACCNLSPTCSDVFKEEVIPTHVTRLVYLLAPGLALVPALIGFAVVR